MSSFLLFFSLASFTVPTLQHDGKMKKKMTSDGSSSTETNEMTPDWDPEVSSRSDSHDEENQPDGAVTLMETGTSDLEENDGDQGSDTNREERRLTTKTLERSPKSDRQEVQTASNSTDADKDEITVDTDCNTISGCHLVERATANRKRCEKTKIDDIKHATVRRTQQFKKFSSRILVIFSTSFKSIKT